MAFFLDRSFGDVNGLMQNEMERLDVEALKKYPCPAACASQRRQPSLTAMTHMRWLRGHESTGYTRSVVFCVGGLRARKNPRTNEVSQQSNHPDDLNTSG